MDSNCDGIDSETNLYMNSDSTEWIKLSVQTSTCDTCKISIKLFFQNVYKLKLKCEAKILWKFENLKFHRL